MKVSVMEQNDKWSKKQLQLREAFFLQSYGNGICPLFSVTNIKVSRNNSCSIIVYKIIKSFTSFTDAMSAGSVHINRIKIFCWYFDNL